MMLKIIPTLRFPSKCLESVTEPLVQSASVCKQLNYGQKTQTSSFSLEYQVAFKEGSRPNILLSSMVLLQSMQNDTFFSLNFSAFCFYEFKYLSQRS